MATLSDFIRWARDQVVENAAVANYKLVTVVDEEMREDVVEFQLDHIAREVYLLSAMERDGGDWDEEPPLEPEEPEEYDGGHN